MLKKLILYDFFYDAFFHYSFDLFEVLFGLLIASVCFNKENYFSSFFFHGSKTLFYSYFPSILIFLYRKEISTCLKKSLTISIYMYVYSLNCYSLKFWQMYCFK